MANKTPIVTFGENTYNVYGAKVGKEVKFAFGTVEKAFSAITTDGTIAFGLDSTNGFGAIYAHGQLASSKILDASISDQTDASYGKTLTIKYVEDGVVKSATLNVIDEESVKILIEGLNTELDGRLDTLEDFAKSSVISSTDKSVKITETVAEDSSFKTYDVSVNIDGVTITKDENGVLSAVGCTYKVVTADETSTGYRSTYQLVQTDAEGTETVISSWSDPKDQVLETVHLCKYPGTGTECVDETEEGFETAEGELYLHFIWANKDASEGTELEDTFVKVTDMAPIYKGDADDAVAKAEEDTEDASEGKYVTINEEHIISIDSEKLMVDTSANFNYGDTLNRLKTIEDDYIISIESANTEVPEDFEEYQEVLKETDLATLTFTTKVDGVDSSYVVTLPSVQSILDIEEVVAAALNEHEEKINDHEERIKTLEAKTLDIYIAEASRDYLNISNLGTTENPEYVLSVDVIDDASQISSEETTDKKLVTANAVAEYVEDKLSLIHI